MHSRRFHLGEAVLTMAASAALLLTVAVSNQSTQAATPEPRDPGPALTAPCSGGERAGCVPVIAPITTPEPRPDTHVYPPTPCSGGERAGC